MSDLTRPALATRTFDLFGFLSRYGTLVALALLIAFNLAFTRNFATLQTLNVNLTQVCTIVIVAVGMTLVIATGGIDLSVGSLMAISGALAPMIFMGKIVPIDNIYLAVAIAMLVSVVVAGLFGLFNGWLVAYFRIQPIVATLVLFIAGQSPIRAAAIAARLLRHEERRQQHGWEGPQRRERRASRLRRLGE